MLPPSWISAFEIPDVLQSFEQSGRAPSDINDYQTASVIIRGLNLVDIPSRLIDLPSFDERIVGTLCGYCLLGEDWDGEGAAPIPIDAIEDALSFLATIPAEASQPKVMALPTGAVSLYWDRGRTYIEISFNGSGNYCAFAKSPGEVSVYIDDARIDPQGNSSSFPLELRNILINAAA
jgi:hypothetical protein